MRWALALAMICMAAPAAAARGPFTYQCTAPFWNDAALWQMDAGPLRHASGRIEVHRLVEIPATQPPGQNLRYVGPIPDMRRAEVSLDAVDDSIRVVLGVEPHGRGSETLDIWVGWQIGEESQSRVLATMPKGNFPPNSIPFTMRVEDRRVIVEAAGVRAEAPVALGDNVEFRAGCRGGEFMFYALDWG